MGKKSEKKKKAGFINSFPELSDSFAYYSLEMIMIAIQIISRKVITHFPSTFVIHK
jgi:hypothetical protein